MSESDINAVTPDLEENETDIVNEHINLTNVSMFNNCILKES